MTITLKAYDADGTEIRPGDTIVSQSGHTAVFRAATLAAEPGGSGAIKIDAWPGREYYSAVLFGLHVVLADSADPCNDGHPGHSDECQAPSLHGPPDTPDTLSEPATLEDALAAADAAPDMAAERIALRKLADAVRDALTPVRGGTDTLAAEADHAARTTAPPVPGVTQNMGYTVYAVIRTNHVPGEPSDDAWIVAAANEAGEHVTWNAYASDSPGPEHERRLHYDTGHYHSPGQGTDSEALADLANRAGVFNRLTELCSGMATREAFQGSHGTVLEELSGTYGVGRARVRAGLLEAAALGYARVSWHGHGERQDYGIRYDRYRCVFTWNREH